MPVPWATIEADPEFQAMDADGQYDIASRWQAKKKAELPQEEHDAFLEASNNRLSKYFAPKAIQAAQFSQSLLGGVTSPLGAATALSSGELQVEKPQPLELAPPIPSIDQTMPPALETPVGLRPEIAPIGAGGTVGELLKTAKEAVSTPPWQGFGVEKIPASIILPGGAAVDLLFNSLGDSKAAQVIQGLHKAGNNQIENMANFMGSPLGVAMMGIGSLGKTAQRIVSLAFAGDMASSQPELWNRFQNATTLREKTETLADAVAGLGLTLTALKHGLTKAEKTTPAEPPPLPSPTPLTDAALGETSPRTQPQLETPNASQITGATSLPQPEVRPPVGGETSLRQQGQAPETRPEVQAEVVPTKEPAPVVPTGEAQAPRGETRVDEQVAFESTDALLSRTSVGAERDAAFAARAAALKRVATSLKSGDVVIADDGERLVVDQVLKDGTVFAYPEGGTAKQSRQIKLVPEYSIERQVPPPAAEGQAKGVTQPPPKEATPSEKEVQGREGQVAPTQAGVPSAEPEAASSKPAAPAEGAPSAPAPAAAQTKLSDVRKWLIWEPTGVLAKISDALDSTLQKSENLLFHGGPKVKLSEIEKGSFKSTGEGIVRKGAGAYVASDPGLAGAFAMRSFRDNGNGVVIVLDRSKLPKLQAADEGNYTVERIPKEAVVRVIDLGKLNEPPKPAPSAAAAPEVPAARTTEAPAGNFAEAYPNTPKEIIRKAKSNLEAGDLPTELRLYSEEERAGIAKDLGVTDTSPEALSEALIDKFAVNKTEKPSPFPKGEVPTEGRTDEIDALAKADEGNDWTEATGPAEIPITPKPSRQAMGITPPGSSAIGKVLVAAKDLGKRIRQAVVDIAEFSDFRKSLLNWSARGQKSSDEIMRAYREIKQSVPNPERREAITNWIQAGGDDALLASRAAASPNIARRRGYELARTLTPEEKAVAQKIRDTFDILRRRAEKYGIEINEIENYVTQIWKRPPREFWPSSGNRLSGAVRFAKARTFETFFAGEQAGWKPQTKDISKLLPIYMNEINNAINARQFVAELAGGIASDGRPLLAPSGIVKTIEEPDARRYLVLPEIKPSEAADYKRLDGHPALHSWRWRAADENGNPIFVYGDLAIHPEAFSHLRKVLGQSALREWWREPSETVLGQIPKSVVKFLIDDVQQVAKATMLGFFSPFHLVQEGTHGIGHKVNPFYNIPKIDMRDPAQMDAARHSLMLQPDRISAAHFKEGLDGHSRNLAAKLAGKIPGVGKYIENWSEQFQQWLFHQYIPGLKYKTYQHIYERNLKRYDAQLKSGKVNEDQVKYLSAQQANAAYGHLNYADMGRNPTIQHIMQTFLLAPDFLEARGRFAAQAAKGLVAKSGREQAVAMATLAGTFWVAARILNQLADGDPHWDKPFEVVIGNRRYRMRSVPEDIYMAVKDTRSFSYGRLSPLIGRGTIEGFSGVNYRGEPTSFGETLTNIVGGMIPLSVQPMTRGLTETGKDNPVSPFEQFLGSIGLHVSRYSPVSETYKLAGKWLDKNADTYGIDQRKGVYPRSKYVALRNALDDGDLDKGKAEIEKLKADEKVGNYQLRQRFAESVNHPFTGSTKTDDIFRKSLDERGKTLFDSAKKRRALLLQRFDLAKERPR